MKKLFCLTFCIAFGLLALLLHAAQQGQSEEARKPRTLKVKLKYTGSGTVDEKRKIYLFFFDSPDFVNGGVNPIAGASGSARDETVTVTGLTASPVYLAGAYDPTGKYDGQSEPPSGCTMALYTKTGEPDPIKIEPGGTTEIELAFDDSIKMP